MTKVSGMVCTDSRDGSGNALVFALGHAAEVDEASSLVDAGDDRWVACAQRLGAVFGKFDGPAGQGYSGSSPAADSTVVFDDRGTDCLGEGFGAFAQAVLVDVEGIVDRVRRVGDGGFERGEGEFVGAQRSGQGRLSKMTSSL